MTARSTRIHDIHAGALVGGVAGPCIAVVFLFVYRFLTALHGKLQSGQSFAEILIVLPYALAIAGPFGAVAGAVEWTGLLWVARRRAEPFMLCLAGALSGAAFGVLVTTLIIAIWLHSPAWVEAVLTVSRLGAPTGATCGLILALIIARKARFIHL